MAYNAFKNELLFQSFPLGGDLNLKEIKFQAVKNVLKLLHFTTDHENIPH